MICYSCMQFLWPLFSIFSDSLFFASALYLDCPALISLPIISLLICIVNKELGITSIWLYLVTGAMYIHLVLNQQIHSLSVQVLRKIVTEQNLQSFVLFCFNLTKAAKTVYLTFSAVSVSMKQNGTEFPNSQVKNIRTIFCSIQYYKTNPISTTLMQTIRSHNLYW